MISDDSDYKSELVYLTDYARQDWLGFSVIAGSAAKLLGSQYTPDREREVTLSLIERLLDSGVQAGDLTADPDRPFIPWHFDKSDALRRIEREMDKLGRLPDSGDICWFTIVE